MNGIYQGKEKVANTVKSLKRRLRSNSKPKKEQISLTNGKKFTWYLRGKKVAVFEAESIVVDRKAKKTKTGTKGGGSFTAHKLIQK